LGLQADVSTAAEISNAWALLLARIRDALPLRCTNYGGAMRIIAFSTDPLKVRDNRSHAGSSAGRLTVRCWPISAGHAQSRAGLVLDWSLSRW
jgi:hypothetical protein